MFSEQRRREEQALLAQDYALETARAEGVEQGRAEGVEQGLERGKIFTFLDLVRQHVLTSEFETSTNGQKNHLVKMAFLELKKYRETSKDSIRKPWLEFFGNKPFTQAPERAISQADQLLDYKSWSEEDRKMFSQLRMREEQALLAQDYALETARAEGVEQGLERGKIFTFLDLVRQHVLTSEFASEQLGMTVAEFEALL